MYHDAPSSIPITKLKTNDKGDIHTIVTQALNAPVPLDRPPLINVTCIDNGKNSVVTLTFSHLIMDGRSMIALVKASLDDTYLPTLLSISELLAVDETFKKEVSSVGSIPYDQYLSSLYSGSRKLVLSHCSNLNETESESLFANAHIHGVSITAILCSAIGHVMRELSNSPYLPRVDFVIAVDARRYSISPIGLGNYATTVSIKLKSDGKRGFVTESKIATQAIKDAVSSWRISEPPILPITTTYPGPAALLSNIGIIDLPLNISDVCIGVTGGDGIMSKLGAGYSPHILVWSFRGQLTLGVFYRDDALALWGSADSFIKKILNCLRKFK